MVLRPTNGCLCDSGQGPAVTGKLRRGEVLHGGGDVVGMSSAADPGLADRALASVAAHSAVEEFGVVREASRLS
ncbi:MAG: hypothetical protein ACYDEA_09700 [Candidatus Dormibacteria bacterium]